MDPDVLDLSHEDRAQLDEVDEYFLPRPDGPVRNASWEATVDWLYATDRDTVNETIRLWRKAVDLLEQNEGYMAEDALWVRGREEEALGAKEGQNDKKKTANAPSL